MKQGELLNGYEVITRPTNAGGGKCMWAFAERDGDEFFIKQFLEPKWPTDSAPGNAASKERRRHDCREFEKRHRHVMERLKSDKVGAGNIVTAESFFREGATYYKVTKRINAANLKSLTKLSPRQQAVVLRTLLLSLQQLHDIGVVHGDLKPDNILVQKRPDRDLYTAKLIDFDDSYVAGHPPSSDTVAGDSLYFAPEWLSYVRNEDGADGKLLTTATDMFALGLILHEYLTGMRPGFPDRYSSAADAVADGQSLALGTELHREMNSLIFQLTQAAPDERPSTQQVLEVIDNDAVLAPVARTAPGTGRTIAFSPRRISAPGPGAGAKEARPEGAGTRGSDRPSRVQIRLGPGAGDRGDHDSDPPADGGAPRASRLRINLGPTAPESPRKDKRAGE